MPSTCCKTPTRPTPTHPPRRKQFNGAIFAGVLLGLEPDLVRAAFNELSANLTKPGDD